MLQYARRITYPLILTLTRKIATLRVVHVYKKKVPLAWKTPSCYLIDRKENIQEMMFEPFSSSLDLSITTGHTLEILYFSSVYLYFSLLPALTLLSMLFQMNLTHLGTLFKVGVFDGNFVYNYSQDKLF